MNRHPLKKSIWSDADFAEMGWHDVTLWSMLADTAAFEFALDLDYIFEWVPPNPGEAHFKFWVAPVTMVFESAFDVKLHIESMQGSIHIVDLHRETIGPSAGGTSCGHTYRFECQEGEISIHAMGYKLYVRRSPELLGGQSFDLEGRNGISFSRATPRQGG